MNQEYQKYLEQMKNSVTPRLTNKYEESTQERSQTSDLLQCPKCKGTGWETYIGENGYEYARECSCGIRQREIQESRLRFASIPETYKDVTLKDIKTSYYTKPESKNLIKAAGEFISWYLENLDKNIEEGKGIYLWSEVKGSGKTMLITALANELINKHQKSVKFATSLDILDEIRATYDPHSEVSESKLLNDLYNTEFLVIDDFGTERATDWVGEKFYQIVNNRYINKKVTFFTSNYDLKTLKYDDRITNRMGERSYIIHFPEESVREFIARVENNPTQQT